MHAYRWSRLFLAVLLLVPAASLPAGEKTRKPNIVVIVADDMGFADVGFQGCKDIPTPNLDALAKGGVRCTNGYVSGPYCSPTRAGLLTGRYQTRFGHEFNPGGGADIGLPVSETTMAQRLKRAGYVTALVGKWHLGDAAKFHPMARGFDEFFGFLGGAHTYFVEKSKTILRGRESIQEKEYLTDAFGREAVNFIDRNQAKPFFLYLAFNAVHTPMNATDERLKQFVNVKDKTRQSYCAMLLAMDQAIGKVTDKLKAAGLEEDTLIFFFSDNGGPTMQGTTINASSNAPLRGSKRTTLEGGIHVPFVIAWKGKIPAGKTYDMPIIQLDVLPTALAAAGVPIDRSDKLDGVDLLPYLKGTQSGRPHDALYWRFGAQMAIREGDWVLVRYDPAADGGKSEKKGGGRVVGPKLYNLADDIGQTKDLFQAHPEKARALQTLWDNWNRELVPPLWGGGKAE